MRLFDLEENSTFIINGSFNVRSRRRTSAQQTNKVSCFESKTGNWNSLNRMTNLDDSSNIYRTDRHIIRRKMILVKIKEFESTGRGREQKQGKKASERERFVLQMTETNKAPNISLWRIVSVKRLRNQWNKCRFAFRSIGTFDHFS